MASSRPSRVTVYPLKQPPALAVLGGRPRGSSASASPTSLHRAIRSEFLAGRKKGFLKGIKGRILSDEGEREKKERDRSRPFPFARDFAHVMMLPPPLSFSPKCLPPFPCPPTCPCSSNPIQRLLLHAYSIHSAPPSYRTPHQPTNHKPLRTGSERASILLIMPLSVTSLLPPDLPPSPPRDNFVRREGVVFKGENCRIFFR